MTTDQEGTYFTKQYRKDVCYLQVLLQGVLPLVRRRLGGWATTVIVLSLLSVVMMIQSVCSQRRGN